MAEADPHRRIAGPADARALFGGIAGAAHEIAVAGYLDRDRHLLGLRFVEGGGGAVTLTPRRVAADALVFDAAGVVMAHNHPDGDATPSRADLALVRQTAAALAAIEVRLLDHLILAGPATVSLRALGLL